jgi:S-disulfanyl-L-cysteine oxidoreductase SoxD
MSSSRRAVGAAALALGLALAGGAAGAAGQGGAPAFQGIGRTATPAEIAAWDLDVRPDFKGLPAGQGSVAAGMALWESRCASCHGVFGESNAVYAPLVGGTTEHDIASGRVARLQDPAYPGRTTMMKLANLSTLWDYIRRAMPWSQPKSLTVPEVYAVTAYMLNLAGVVADDFVLSDRNIADVQKRVPNRDGLTRDHAMWPGGGFGSAARPDVRASASCMRDCRADTTVVSTLPDHARNVHGNLAEQNRLFGAQVGADTTRPTAGARPIVAATAAASAAATDPPARALAAPQALALARKHNCVVCHAAADQRLLGPGFAEVARKYASRPDAAAYLSSRIASGGSGVWGAVPMPPQEVPVEDMRVIAQWIADGAKR